MPENKIDFGELIAAGYDSRFISDYSNRSGAEVILNNPEYYQKAGYTPEQVEATTNAYDAYKRNEYVAITGNTKAIYGTSSLYEQFLHPEVAQFRRGNQLGDMRATVVEAGFDVYGNQIKTPGEVADERGQYRTKDGQWANLGGEFWNWAGNGLLSLVDLQQTIAGGSPFGRAEEWLFQQFGMDHPSELINNQLHSLASSKVLQYDPNGLPYWQSFNPYENPKELKPQDFSYKGIFPDDVVDERNRVLMMNPKGYQRSVYGPQDIDSKSVLGGIWRGTLDFATTFIPTFTAGLAGEHDIQDSILGVQSENSWSYLKSIERGNTLYTDKTRHLRSIEGQEQKWYQGEQLGYGIGDVIGQIGMTFLTASAGTTAGLTARAAGSVSTGIMSMYGTYAMKETMVDMNMSAREQAIMLPVFFGTTFATERLIGGNIVENGLFRVTTKEAARDVAKKAVVESWNDVLTKYGVSSVKELTRAQRLVGAKYIAKSFITKALSTEHVVGRALSTGWEEGREELIEQGLNDIEMTLHDYFVTLEDNTSNIGYVGTNKTDATFKNYDTTKSMIGNLVANIDGDQYAQSFVLGFAGGLSGGIFRGRNKSKASEDWMIDQIIQGNEKQMIKAIKRTDLLLDYVHHDGKRVLNEQDKVDGVPSMNDLAKNKIIQDIEYLVQMRDSLGLRSSEQLKKFAGDKSLLKEAMQLGLTSSKLNQEATKILQKEGVTEEETKQAQEYQRQAAELNQRLQNDYMKEENKGGGTSKAYNTKLKKGLTLKHLAEQQVNEIYKEAHIDVNNMTGKQKLEYNNMVSASAVSMRASEIEDGITIYDKYKQFPRKLEEFKAAKQAEINGNLSERVSKLDKFFADTDSKINALRSEIESFVSSISSDPEFKTKDDFKKSKGHFEFAIPELANELDVAMQENSAFTDIHKTKLAEYRTNLDEIYNTLESNEVDIEILKETDPFSIDNISLYNNLDNIIIDSQRELENIDPHENLNDVINEKIDLLQTLIDNKSPYAIVKDAYDSVQGDINDAIQFYIIGNKAIDKIDQKYRSEDDIVVDDETYNSTMKRLAEAANRLKQFESIVSEYAGNKNALTRNYKVEEMRLRFQQWKNQISTYENFGKVFGNDAAEVSAIINSMMPKFTKEEKWLTSKDITDEQLNDLNKSLTRLSDLFYTHAEAIFADEEFLKHLTKDFFFGGNGLGSMNGMNSLASNIFDEPINLFNAVDDDHIDEFYIPQKSTVQGIYYYKFMSMYMFNNLMAMGGVKMSGALNQYSEMQKAIESDAESTPSSFEQYTMEIQAVGIALALRKGYADKLITEYLKQAKQRIAGASALEASFDRFQRVPNYFNFTGFGGSGKTKNSVAKFITLYSRMTGKTDMKIQVASFNDAATNQLFEQVSATGHKTTKTKFYKMEDVNVDVDMIIFDESTLIKSEEMDVLREKIEASKNKPIIVAFGDNTQMSAHPYSWNDPTFYAGPTMNPLMNVYRTNVAPLIMIQEYFRKMIFATTFDVNTVPIPKMSQTTDEEDNLIGGAWMGDSQSVIEAANKRRDKNMALIVLTKANKDKVLSDPSNKLNAGQIFVANDFLDIRDESIQGLQRDEIYVAFNPTNLEIEAGKTGYTAVGRARNFVAIVGPLNDKEGKPMNVGVSGFIGSKAKPMSTEEKKAQSDALLAHINGSFDKNDSAFDFPKEPTTEKTKTTSPTTTTDKETSSSAKTKKSSAPDQEEQKRTTTDKNGTDIAPGDVVIVNGNVTPVKEVIGDTVETGKGNSKGSDVLWFDPLADEDNQPDVYIIDESATTGDFVGNAVVDKTNPDDVQQTIDRNTYSYFSVNHIAIPIDRTFGNIEKVKEHARKIKIRSYSDALIYARKNGAFEFEERQTTEWDGREMVPVQKKVLVLKINDILTKRFVDSYNNSLPKSMRISPDDIDAVYDAVTNFFVIPEDSPASEELYKKLNADETLVTRIQIEQDEKTKNDFIFKAPLIGYDKSSPEKKNLPSSQDFKKMATDLGYKTEYIWKVSGRESGAGRGIAYIRIISPNGKVRDVKLTALTVAEFNQKKPNGQVRYESMLASELQNIHAEIGTKPIGEINKMFRHSAVYNFLAKNNMKQYIATELKDSDAKSRIENLITLVKSTGLSDKFIAYTNENIGVVSRPATLTPFVIGNPQQFAIISETKVTTTQKTDKKTNISDLNPDTFNFERQDQSKGEMRFDEANKLIAKILGDTIAEMAVKNVPQDSDFYNDLRNLVGSFSGFFSGNIIGLRTENGYTRATTPRHEATHFVCRYFLSPRVKTQLYDEGKQRIHSETGRAIGQITDLEAEELIATTYGRSDGNLDQPWYAKFPMINRFMQKMKMFFAQLGLYSYKINDLMNSMEDGFFANGEVELQESDYMLEPDHDDVDIDSETNLAEKIEPYKAVSMTEIVERDLKDNLGETLYAMYKSWFGNGIFENNVIGQTNSTIVDFNDSVRQVQKEWSELYPGVSADTLLTKIDGSTISVANVIYGNEINVGLKLDGDNKKILAAALFNNPTTSTIFAKANIPNFTADSGIASSNIGKDGNKKNPQELAKGLLALGVNNIRPNGWGTPRLNFPSLLSDFYNSCISGTNERPNNIHDVVTKMRNVVNTSNQNQDTVKNMNRFIQYYDFMQDKYQRLPLSKRIVIDEFFNAVASILVSQKIAPMSTAHAILKDEKINKIKQISKHFNSRNNLKVEIKNKWNDAIISNGEVTAAATKRVKTSGETKGRDTMFVISDGEIKFTDGQESSTNYISMLKVGKNGIFSITDDYIGKLKENDPTAIRGILKIYEFLGISSIFNTDLLMNLIRDNADKKFNEVYPALKLTDDIISESLGSHIAGMMNSTIVHRKTLDIYAAAMQAQNSVEYDSENAQEEAVNRFKDVLTLYSRGEVPFSDVTKTPFIQNKVKSTEELFGGLEIPASVLSNVKYFNNFKNLNKVASGIEDAGTAEDVANDSEERLRVFRPTDNFPFAELLAKIGWEYRVNNVDNRIVMPGGGTMSAIGIVSSLDMAKEKALKDQKQVTPEENMLITQYESGDRVNSIFLTEEKESEIIEINGFENNNFGTNDISASDLFKIHLFSYVDGKKNGNTIIPLSTFADSGRNFLVRISDMNDSDRKTMAVTAYENQINKAISNYEMNVSTWISLINKLSSDKTSLGIILPELNFEDFTGNNMTESNIKRFNDSISGIEQSLYQRINTPEGKNVYYKWSKMVAASDLENISGKKDNGIAFYNTDMGFVDQIDMTNDQIEYIPVRRFIVGQSGQFGMNRQGPLSLKNMFEYMDKFGRPDLITTVKKASDGITNYDYLYNKMYPIAKRAWDNIVEGYGGDKPESMMPEVVEGKVKLAKDFQEFIMLTQLIGEEFMSTYVTGLEAVDTPENMSKYIKTILTPGVRMVENNLLKDNLKVMYISETFGVNDRGQIANLTDGGDYVSSLAQRIINHSLGGRFAANSAYSNKALNVSMNNTIGNHKIVKSSTFTATDSMMENCPTLRKMEMVMLYHTVIDGVNFGERYSQLWNQGKKHSEIIDELEDIYMKSVYDSRSLNPGQNLVWKMVPESNIKRGMSRVNVGTVDELLMNPIIKGEPNVLSDVSPEDIAFIYNPETKIDETTRTKKTIQKTSICSWLDYNEDGSVRKIDTLNDIISKQNDISLKKFEDMVGIRFDTFLYGTTTEKERDAKKLEAYMKKVARSGLEGQGTSAVLSEMINSFSLNTPNVYESVMQVFTNQLANKYGHRRGVSGDRMIQQFGHQFMMLIDPKTGKKYNLAELNKIKMMEDVRQGNNPERLDLEDFIDLGYQPRSMGYMKHDDKGVHIGEVALTFKYFDFFGLKTGEQPADLCTIWKNDGTAIDIRYWDTLPEFSVMRGDLETKYYVKDGEFFNETKDGGVENITEQEYLRNFTFEIANNPDIYDHESTVLLRNTTASFQDKLLMAKDSLKVQMDRVPYSTPGFTVIAEIVAFTNEKIADTMGSERERLPNTAFINMRESLRDGSDNDGDTKAVFYKSIVSERDSEGNIHYSFTSAKDMNDDNYDKLSNLYLDRIEALLLNKKNVSSVFGTTTTSNMEKTIKRKQDEEQKNNKKPYRQISDWGAIIDIYQSNQNDSSSIGNFANSSNVFAELITMSMQGYNVYKGPFVKTVEEKIRAIEVFSQLLNAATDGVKKSILGPMNIITEFTNLAAYFVIGGKIPAFLVDPKIDTDEEIDFVPEGTNWDNAYDFFTSPLMQKIAKRVISGRSLLESSFANNIYFTVHEMIKNIEVNGRNYDDFNETLGKVDYTKFDLELYKKAKALYASIPDIADNEKTRGRLQNILINLENLRALKKLESILPYSESIFMLSQINSQRQKVLSKTFERDAFIDQLGLVFGREIKHTKLENGVFDIFYNNGELRDSKDFEKKYQEVFGNNYSEIASEYYNTHSPEFVRQDNDERVLKKDSISNYTNDYKEYIKKRYEAVDTVRYAYGLRYGAEFMKNILFEDAIGKELSFIEGNLIPDAQTTYFDDNRDNTYSDKKKRQEIRDGYVRGSINAAFEYNDMLKDISFGFRFKPEGITTSNVGIDWTSGGNIMRMENQRDRNRFLLSFPAFVMNLKEAVNMGKLARAQDAIQYLMNIPGTPEGIAESEKIVNALQNNRFFNKISRGSGATPVLQYSTRANTEENAAFLIEERMDFMKLPEQLRNMFVAYNLMHYGYRQSKSFLEVVATSNKYYEEVDKFRNETIEEWKISNPEMYESFIRKTLDQLYVSKKLISHGAKLTARDVHKRAFMRKIHLSIGNKKVINGLKVDTAVFKDENSNDYTAHFSSMPSIGAEYSYNGKGNQPQSELFAITLKVSMRELDTLLNTGELILPNRVSTYQSSDSEGLGIVYLVHGYTCVSDPNYGVSGSIRLKLSDNIYYQNKNAIRFEENNEGTMLQNDRYNNYKKTSKDPADLKIVSYRGQLKNYPETKVNSVVVHNATFDYKFGEINGFQFTNTDYKNSGITIPIEVASTPRGFGFPKKSEDVNIAEIKKANIEYNIDMYNKLKSKLEGSIYSLRKAKKDGKTIIFPKEGLAKSLLKGGPEQVQLFNWFSKTLLNEFGYLNPEYKEDTKEPGGLKMVVFEKMDSEISSIKAFNKFVDSNGKTIPGSIESIINELIESFPSSRYVTDSNEARIKDSVDFIKGMLKDYNKDKVSLKNRIENEEKKCNE